MSSDHPQVSAATYLKIYGVLILLVLGYFAVTSGPVAMWQFFFGKPASQALATPNAAPSMSPSSTGPTSSANQISPVSTIAILAPGHTGVITLGSDGTRLMAVTAQAYYDMANAARLNDRVGILQMVADGKVEIVNRETKVLILDGTSCCPRLARMRVQEGPLFGDAVWLPPEFVRSD